MRKLVIILAVSLIGLFFAQCTSNQKALNKKLTEMAMNLNVSTPVMLDAHTRFERASVTPDNLFRYHYTITNTPDPDSLMNSALQQLQENIRTEFSSNPDLLIFKKNKVNVEYIYNDENNRNIRTIVITPQDYQ